MNLPCPYVDGTRVRLIVVVIKDARPVSTHSPAHMAPHRASLTNTATLTLSTLFSAAGTYVDYTGADGCIDCDVGKIASKAAMIDVISQGRLDVGFARAYLPYEFEAFGVAMNGSRERYAQTIEAVQRLWQQKDVSMDTAYFAFDGANCLPEVYIRGYY